MDLQFPHHECEIAQSEVAHGQLMARYWVHNNMITINGKKMGKSYNNQIKLTELFAGTHPILERAYSPMTIRFFILQTHYRSTLDFSNEALQAAEKGLQRLWQAHEVIQKLSYKASVGAVDKDLDERIQQWCAECETAMLDDLSTPKVLANLFEMTPVINSLKSQQIPMHALQESTFQLMKHTFSLYLIDLLGLKPEVAADESKLDAVLQILIQMRREAKLRKDFTISDKIRNELAEVGIQLKDEKDGNVSYSL
jgi:cysteinyl-tRNA synthetase